MIRLKNISKLGECVDHRSYILRDLDLDVAAGEFLGIVAPPGSGKSALLNIIGLQEQPSSGCYEFCGTDVHDLDLERKELLLSRDIGYILQHHRLDDHLTVYENLELPLLLCDYPGKKRDNKILRTLERFYIKDLRDNFPPQISTLQRQLTAIARAVVAEPKLLLADEPTAGLNPHLAKGILALLKSLNSKGTTVIYATSSESRKPCCSRVLHLDEERSRR